MHSVIFQDASDPVALGVEEKKGRMLIGPDYSEPSGKKSKSIKLQHQTLLIKGWQGQRCVCSSENLAGGN